MSEDDEEIDPLFIVGAFVLLAVVVANAFVISAIDCEAAVVDPNFLSILRCAVGL